MGGLKLQNQGSTANLHDLTGMNVIKSDMEWETGGGSRRAFSPSVSLAAGFCNTVLTALSLRYASVIRWHGSPSVSPADCLLCDSAPSALSVRYAHLMRVGCHSPPSLCDIAPRALQVR